MKLLMLGNGFDLYHKLPTTYLCFLKTADLIRNMSKMPENIGEVFYKLKDECKDINNSYTAYKGFYDAYSFNETDKGQIEKLKAIISDNMWFKFFCNTYNKDVGWIDFEKEISRILLIFSEVLKGDHILNQPRDRIYYSTENLSIREFDVFFSESTTYRMLHFKDEYLTNSLYGVNKYSVNKRKIYKILYDQLNELSETLNIYLSVFVEKTLQKMHEQNIVKTNKLFAGFYNVITFNYTNTYELLYGNASIHYIHGNLDTNIVLGVNPDKGDELPDLDTSYIMFKKYYQRVYHRTDNGFIEMINNIKKDKNILNPPHNDLVVCGHSLDSTDQDIIKEVFDISDNIYIVCHDLDKIGNYISNLVKIYGKNGLDKIRSEKELRFITYEEWEDVEYVHDLIAQTIGI